MPDFFVARLDTRVSDLKFRTFSVINPFFSGAARERWGGGVRPFWEIFGLGAFCTL